MCGIVPEDDQQTLSYAVILIENFQNRGSTGEKERYLTVDTEVTLKWRSLSSASFDWYNLQTMLLHLWRLEYWLTMTIPFSYFQCHEAMWHENPVMREQLGNFYSAVRAVLWNARKSSVELWAPINGARQRCTQIMPLGKWICWLTVVGRYHCTSKHQLTSFDTSIPTGLLT